MKLADLKTLVMQLEARIKFLEDLNNVEGEWIDPTQASKLWAFGRDRIMNEIRVAEKARVIGDSSDLEYGEHYISSLFQYDYKPGRGLVENPEKTRNTWLVHSVKFWEVVKRPLNERVFPKQVKA